MIIMKCKYILKKKKFFVKVSCERKLEIPSVHRPIYAIEPVPRSKMGNDRHT